MGFTASHVTYYVCDTCGKEMEVESITGLSPPWPPGWWGINPSSPEHDMFCSWDCLGAFAMEKSAQAKARAETRAQVKAESAEASA